MNKHELFFVLACATGCMVFSGFVIVELFCYKRFVNFEGAVAFFVVLDLVASIGFSLLTLAMLHMFGMKDVHDRCMSARCENTAVHEGYATVHKAYGTTKTAYLRVCKEHVDHLEQFVK